MADSEVMILSDYGFARRRTMQKSGMGKALELKRQMMRQAAGTVVRLLRLVA